MAVLNCQAEPVIPETRIAILLTGDPGKVYTYLYRIITRAEGIMESVSAGEALNLMLPLARSAGTAVEWL